MDKEMVMDPATGKMVTAPEYVSVSTLIDVVTGRQTDGVLEFRSRVV